jgi:hypothetical protein
MSATEAFIRVGEKERSGSHQFLTRRRAILKRAAHYDGNRRSRMLLFERLVARACSANHVGNRPAVARSQLPRDRMSASRLFFASDRNFRQDLPCLQVLQP